MDKLMVLRDNVWEYVFCYNPTIGIVTTLNPKKALTGLTALDYFQRIFGNDNFKIERG